MFSTLQADIAAMENILVTCDLVLSSVTFWCSNKHKKGRYISHVDSIFLLLFYFVTVMKNQEHKMTHVPRDPPMAFPTGCFQNKCHNGIKLFWPLY